MLSSDSFENIFELMSATLTMEVDAEVLVQAGREAKARNVSVPAAVEQLLRVMAENWRSSQMGESPITDSLRGSVKLPPGVDWRDIFVCERFQS